MDQPGQTSCMVTGRTDLIDLREDLDQELGAPDLTRVVTITIRHELDKGESQDTYAETDQDSRRAYDSDPHEGFQEMPEQLIDNLGKDQESKLYLPEVKRRSSRKGTPHRFPIELLETDHPTTSGITHPHASAASNDGRDLKDSVALMELFVTDRRSESSRELKHSSQKTLGNPSSVRQLGFNQSVELKAQGSTSPPTDERLQQGSQHEQTLSCVSNFKRRVTCRLEERPYQCSVCGRTFIENAELKAHMMIHAREKPFLCTISSNGFLSGSDTQKHAAVCEAREKIKTVPCSFCDKSFQYHRDLVSHMRIHTGEKPYQCSVCDKKFSWNASLRSHMVTHTGEKSYQCPYCEKCLSRHGSLMTHILTHTGERPYKCSVCAERFSQNSHLTKHMRIHTGERPHQCSVCQKRFKCASNLKRHLTSHSGEKPYECAVCGRRFRENGDLKVHMMIHTGERPHQCTVCEKRFARKETLAKHVKIHTGDRPYQCSFCDMRFIQQGNWKRHVELHQRKEVSLSDA